MPSPKEKYYRIKGKYGTYILTEKEMNKAIDRENSGIKEKIHKEKDYSLI